MGPIDDILSQQTADILDSQSEGLMAKLKAIATENPKKIDDIIRGTELLVNDPEAARQEIPLGLLQLIGLLANHGYLIVLRRAAERVNAESN